MQLLCPKRGAGHRARGYFYIYAMLVADGTALLVYRFTGQFNILHAGAFLNLFCIVWRLRRCCAVRGRQIGAPCITTWIAWSYVGLIAAAVTQAVMRPASR